MARLYLNRTLRPFLSRPAVDRGLRVVEASLVGAAMATTRHLSVERASDLGDHLGRRIGPRSRKDQNVQANLAVAFPGRDRHWLAETSAEIWAQIGRTLAEYPHLPRISGPELHARFELVNHVPMRELTSARGLILAAPHQANWNLHTVAGVLAGFPLSVIYAKQKNDVVEQKIARYRNAIPAKFIHVRDTVRHTMAELMAGRSVGLLVDHRIDEGELVPFFGHPAHTTTIAARIAAKLDSAIVPTRLERLPGVRFRLTLEPPLRREPGDGDLRESAFAMTKRLNERFAAWIGERPTEWCCVKRRWPKDITEKARFDAGLIEQLGEHALA